MVVQLLDPTLFKSPDDMVENRHRLNTVVFRRTKADACRPDGSPLFVRRWVHTESFLMSADERGFYEKLYGEARVIIKEEYALADDPVGRSEVDRVLADLKLRLVKRLDEDELERV